MRYKHRRIEEGIIVRMFWPWILIFAFALILPPCLPGKGAIYGPTIAVHVHDTKRDAEPAEGSLRSGGPASAAANEHAGAYSDKLQALTDIAGELISKAEGQGDFSVLYLSTANKYLSLAGAIGKLRLLPAVGGLPGSHPDVAQTEKGGELIGVDPSLSGPIAEGIKKLGNWRENVSSLLDEFLAAKSYGLIYALESPSGKRLAQFCQRTAFLEDAHVGFVCLRNEISEVLPEECEVSGSGRKDGGERSVDLLQDANILSAAGRAEVHLGVLADYLREHDEAPQQELEHLKRAHVLYKELLPRQESIACLSLQLLSLPLGDPSRAKEYQIKRQIVAEKAIIAAKKGLYTTEGKEQSLERLIFTIVKGARTASNEFEMWKTAKGPEILDGAAADLSAARPLYENMEKLAKAGLGMVYMSDDMVGLLESLEFIALVNLSLGTIRADVAEVAYSRVRALHEMGPQGDVAQQRDVWEGLLRDALGERFPTPEFTRNFLHVRGDIGTSGFIRNKDAEGRTVFLSHDEAEFVRMLSELLEDLADPDGALQRLGDLLAKEAPRDWKVKIKTYRLVFPAAGLRLQQGVVQAECLAAIESVYGLTIKPTDDAYAEETRLLDKMAKARAEDSRLFYSGGFREDIANLNRFKSRHSGEKSAER